LILSVVFASWAFAVYMHTNLAKAPGPDGKARVAALNEQINQLLADRGRAEGLYQVAGDELAALDARHEADLAWYREVVRTMRTGNDAKGQKVDAPVKVLVFADGQVQADKDGRPVLQNPAQPLPAYDNILREIDDTWARIKQERNAIHDLVVENT